jgi:inhibitor of KinA
MTAPIFRPIADYAVLVEFGSEIDDATHARACAFDAALDHAEIHGMVERVPTYTTVYVGYDALVTDFPTMVEAIKPYLMAEGIAATKPNVWEIPTCYDPEFAPDLVEVEDILKMPFVDIVAHQSAARYKVYMYGFAPGYAYLGGVPKPIHIPRKTGPVLGVETRTVMIAGPQALITTVTLPSGWWRIGRAAKSPLQDDPERPFLFDVGDEVRFKPVSKDELHAHEAPQ